MYNNSGTCEARFQTKGNCCGGHKAHFWGKKFGRGEFPPFKTKETHVPVNIRETENSYEIHLFSPGLTKEDFNISITDDLLTITYLKSDAGTETNWARQEFHQQSFERSFVLNNKIDTSNIAAKYVEGVLQVTLPKNPEAFKPTQGITVA